MHFASPGNSNRDVVTALLKSSLSAAQPLSSERALQLEVPKTATRLCCGERHPQYFPTAFPPLPATLP